MTTPLRNATSILPLALEGVSFEAGGKRLIKDITCRFEAGPRTVIIGANGAGKSLLLRLCHGLVGPSAGRIAWLGAEEMGLDPAPHQAMVFQRPVMLRRSVTANVDYALSLRGMPRAERAERVARALARTGIRGRGRHPARVLSVGEQQRLALTRAWALDPQVLFLDEPTSSLDPASALAVEDVVNAIHKAGTCVIMTTHDLGQARRMGDEIIFLHRGRILERAGTERFFTAPENDLAQAFIRGELVR